EVRAPWRESSGEATEYGQDRDYGAQPQLRRRSRFAAAIRSRAHAYRPERLDARRSAPSQPASIQRAVSPGGFARPPRLALSVQGLCEADGGVEGCLNVLISPRSSSSGRGRSSLVNPRSSTTPARRPARRSRSKDTKLSWRTRTR